MANRKAILQSVPVPRLFQIQAQEKVLDTAFFS